MTPSENFALLQRVGATRKGMYLCPLCSHLRSTRHRKIKCLSVDVARDGIGIVFKCWHCRDFSGYASDDLMAAHES
jgi:hypothetical protein